MNFGYDSIIGISAAFLTTLSFLPQIVKAYRTRRMKDVSRYLMILFTTGSILWIIYGIILRTETKMKFKISFQNSCNVALCYAWKHNIRNILHRDIGKLKTEYY